MRTLLLILTFFLTNAAFGADIPGTVIFNPITLGTTEATNKHIGDTSEMKGTPKQVANTTERDAIPASRRREGMEVWVSSELRTYHLVSGIDNANWFVKNGIGSPGLTSMFFGHNSGNTNSSGIYNSSLGVLTLNSNSSGSYNSSFGGLSLQNNTIGEGNTCFGYATMAENTSGKNNTALGMQVLAANTIGWYNLGAGVEALRFNTSGSYNTGVGAYDTLLNNTVGWYNSALGFAAMYSNTIGSANVSLGVSSMYGNILGSNNLAAGASAGYHNNGNANVFLGGGAGYFSTTGNSNILIGQWAQAKDPAGHNQLNIGNMIFGSSNFIGIGSATPSPTMPLEVYSTVDGDVSYFRRVGASNNVGLLISADELNAQVNVIATGSSLPEFGLWTGGAERIHMQSDGTVGIGTDTPQATLHVWGQLVGTNLLVNGDFTSDSTGWSGGNATVGIISGGQSGNALAVTNSIAASGYGRIAITTVAGKRYQIIWYHKNGTSAGYFALGTSFDGGEIFSGSTQSDALWTRKTAVEFVARTTTTWINLYVNSSTAGHYSLFDSITWKEVGGGDLLSQNLRIDNLTGNSNVIVEVISAGTNDLLRLSSTVNRKLTVTTNGNVLIAGKVTATNGFSIPTNTAGLVLTSDSSGNGTWQVPANGETNTASSLGAGWPVTAGKSGVDLRFNSITNGNGAIVASNNNVLTVHANLVAGNNINLTTNGQAITITSVPGSGDYVASASGISTNMTNYGGIRLMGQDQNADGLRIGTSFALSLNPNGTDVSIWNNDADSEHVYFRASGHTEFPMSLSVGGPQTNAQALTVLGSLNATTNIGAFSKDVTLLVMNTYYTNDARRLSLDGTFLLNPDAVTAASSAAIFVDWDADGTWDEKRTNSVPPGVSALTILSFHARIPPSARYLMTNVGLSVIAPVVGHTTRTWE